MTRIALAVLLLVSSAFFASSAFAQQVSPAIPTPATADGFPIADGWWGHVSSNINEPYWQTINRPQAAAPASCAPKPIATAPHVYLLPTWGPDVQSSSFNVYQSMARYSYPDDTTITKFDVTACWHLNGTLPDYTIFSPGILDRWAATIIEPSYAEWAGFGYYPPPSSTDSAFRSTWSWVLPTPLSSMDLNDGRYEFGWVTRRPWSNNTYYFYPDAVKMHSMTWRPWVTPTQPLQLNVSAPTLTYTPSGTWSQGTLRIRANTLKPSYAQGLRATLRCGDGVERNLPSPPGSSSTFPWGATHPTADVVYSISSLNSNTCPTAPLTQGMSTRVSVQPLNYSGQTVGGPSYSSTVSLF